MDGKGRYTDNVFGERLWRTMKYEEVFLKAYANGTEARRGLGGCFRFYNDQRPLSCPTDWVRLTQTLAVSSDSSSI